MKAGLEVAKVMRNASPVEAPAIDLEANSDVDVAIETAESMDSFRNRLVVRSTGWTSIVDSERK